MVARSSKLDTGFMPFRPEDIEPAGHVPGTTAIAYTVARDGEIVGCVHAPQAPGWLNVGQDPREQIARRLNAVEESEGFEKLATHLRATLDLG
jgi:hypothetical protein